MNHRAPSLFGGILQLKNLQNRLSWCSMVSQHRRLKTFVGPIIYHPRTQIGWVFI